MASSKPKLTFWQIWNMSFGFLGIQFGFALQNANTSRIFETLGASVDDIPILWIAAPVTGLLVQPIVGYFSDKTWTSLGRRRPYFLVGAILTSIALCLMPNSPALWVAAGTLWLMDASINVSMEPFRAFVGDNLPVDQRTLGFSMQSFFIGIGAVLGSAMPYIFTQVGVSNTAPEGIIPDSVKWSFYIGAVVILVTILWTVFRSKEYSPEEMESFEDETIDEDEEVSSEVLDQKASSQLMRNGKLMAGLGLILSIALFYLGLEKELYILSFGVLITGLLFLLAARFSKTAKTSAFVTIMSDMLNMPKTMKQLTWVQFFSWFALFSMWIYTTNVVTSHIYGTSDTTSQAYNDGADWVTILFAVQNGVAALIAFALPVFAKLTSRKVTHMVALIAGGLGLASFYFITSPNLLILSMVGVGIAWASILSMPYAMLSGALPQKKMGYYMGVFNFFIVIPQIVAATILGFLVNKFFGGEAVYALIVGGLAMIIAGILSLRVEDNAT